MLFKKKKVKAEAELSQPCSFKVSLNAKPAAERKEKNHLTNRTIVSMLWWVCFSLAETMLYGNSKLILDMESVGGHPYF